MTLADLSPDALARLEAKLLADVEVIRKMRALLEQHGSALGTMAVPATTPVPPAPATPPAAMSAPAPAIPAPTQPETPAAPRRSLDDMQLEALATLAGKTFLMEDLRRAIYQVTRHHPESASLKVLVNRLMREGKVAIEERRTGRNGSVYRCLIQPSPAG